MRTLFTFLFFVHSIVYGQMMPGILGAVSSGGLVDGIDTYTKLMLHCNGTNGSTTFTDSELTPKTVTANGNARISTSSSKFGGASAAFDGSGDYLTVPTSADFGFGSGDFTIDCWINFNSFSGTYGIVERDYGASGNTWWFFRKESSSSTCDLRFFVLESGVTKADYTITTPTSISTGTWYHIAVVRSGSNIYMFLNGVSQTLTATTSISTNSISNNGNNLNIGTGRDHSSEFLNGYIDELRISKGVARWTSNFTPYTYEYK